MFDFSAVPETFTAPLRYRPTGGGAPVEIDVEWRYKSVADYFAWVSRAGRETPDTELLGEVIAGWTGVAQPYSPDALKAWLDAQPGAAMQFFIGYREALFGARAKN